MERYGEGSASVWRFLRLWVALLLFPSEKSSILFYAEDDEGFSRLAQRGDENFWASFSVIWLLEKQRRIVCTVRLCECGLREDGYGRPTFYGRRSARLGQEAR